MSSEAKPPAPAPSVPPPQNRGPTRSAAKQMIWFGAAGLFALAIYNAIGAPPEAGPLWRVFAGIVACLYLWWLGTMLFDLVFVWHRYIRHAVAMKFLRAEVAPAELSVKSTTPPHRPRASRGGGDFPSAEGGSPAKKPTGPVVAPGASPIREREPRPSDHDQPLGMA